MHRTSASDARFRWTALSVWALCLGLLLAACGDQPPSPTPVAAPTTAPTTAPATAPTAAAGQPAAPTAAAVDLSNFKFSPADITIAAGGTVVWTNRDPAKHTVTANDGSFDSGNLDQGATFSRTFATPGDFPYFCKFHGSPGQGMSG